MVKINQTKELSVSTHVGYLPVDIPEWPQLSLPRVICPPGWMDMNSQNCGLGYLNDLVS